MAIVGRDLIVALLLSLLLESRLVLPHISLGIVTLLQLGLRRVLVGRVVTAFVGLAFGFGQLFLLKVGVVLLGEQVDVFGAVVVVAVVLLICLWADLFGRIVA